MSEKKTLGAKYIFVFDNDCELLIHHSSVLKNLMIELQHKYNSPDDIKALDDSEKDALRQLTQNVRYYANKTYIEYLSITRLKGIDADKEIQALHDALNDKFILPSKELDKYIIIVDSLRINDIIQDVLVSNADVMQQIYGDSHAAPKADK